MQRKGLVPDKKEQEVHMGQPGLLIGDPRDTLDLIPVDGVCPGTLFIILCAGMSQKGLGPKNEDFQQLTGLAWPAKE